MDHVGFCRADHPCLRGSDLQLREQHGSEAEAISQGPVPLLRIRLSSLYPLTQNRLPLNRGPFGLAVPFFDLLNADAYIGMGSRLKILTADLEEWIPLTFV